MDPRRENRWAQVGLGNSRGELRPAQQGRPMQGRPQAAQQMVVEPPTLVRPDRKPQPQQQQQQHYEVDSQRFDSEQMPEQRTMYVDSQAQMMMPQPRPQQMMQPRPQMMHPQQQMMMMQPRPMPPHMMQQQMMQPMMMQPRPQQMMMQPRGPQMMQQSRGPQMMQPRGPMQASSASVARSRPSSASVSTAGSVSVAIKDVNGAEDEETNTKSPRLIGSGFWLMLGLSITSIMLTVGLELRRPPAQTSALASGSSAASSAQVVSSASTVSSSASTASTAVAPPTTVASTSAPIAPAPVVAPSAPAPAVALGPSIVAPAAVIPSAIPVAPVAAAPIAVAPVQVQQLSAPAEAPAVVTTHKTIVVTKPAVAPKSKKAPMLNGTGTKYAQIINDKSVDVSVIAKEDRAALETLAKAQMESTF